MVIEQIDRLKIHFVLCTERTGSSLLSMMLNINSKILSPSEEPFALYFYSKYKNKTNWTDEDIAEYVDAFWLMAEKNLKLYFTSKKQLLNNLVKHKDVLNYERLIKITYLNFLEPKSKEQIEIIVDKQIKYFFHLPQIVKIFPSAKFIILTRDVRDNIVSKSQRGLNWINNPIFLSSLWKYTYSNINYLKANQKDFIIIKYENVVTNTKNELVTICEFLNIPYQPKMENTDSVYEAFLKSKSEKVGAEFIASLENFHSGMFSQPNTSKIGIYKKEGNAKLMNKVSVFCQDLLKNLSYEVEVKETSKLSITDYWFIFLAYLYRPFLLSFYFKIPLSLKLLIKKIRPRKVNV
jgi:hypothetical protein